jgi:hypothetical protein
LTDTIKPKRKLKNIDFSGDTAHIALVSKSQGGPANLSPNALILKSGEGSSEFIQKMQKVKVTMEIPEFLETFFCLYEDDAEVLAAMMGYTEGSGEDDAGTYSRESFWSWYRDKNPGESVWDLTPEQEDVAYQEFIASQLSGIEIIKSLKGATSQVKALTKLDEDSYLSFALMQEKVEKALKNKDSAVAKFNEEKKVVLKAAKTTKTKEVNMPGAIQEQDLQTSFVALQKSFESTQTSYVELQKSFEDQKVELQKAQEIVAELKKEKQEQVEKARFEVMKAAVKDEAKAAVLFKAVKDSSDEDFQAVVKSLTEISKAVEQGDLFKENGASGEGAVQDQDQESSVAKILKAKQVK